ncbi:MAG: MlaD family protein [Burkholderiales bacterium]
MENKAHALAAGIFLLLATALLVGLTVWLTSDRQAVRLYEMSTREAVNGLQLQAPVRYRGIAIGKVTTLGFDPQNKGNALVRITVDENAPISTSTFATLNFQGVTGLAFVQLDDDDSDNSKPLPEPDKGYPKIPIRQNLLSSLSDQSTTMLAQVEETSKRINQLFAPENQQVLMGMVTNLAQAANDLAKLTVQLDRTLAERLDPALAGVPPLLAEGAKTLATLQRAGNEFGKIAKQMSAKGGVIDQLGDSGESLAQAAAKLNNRTLPSTTRAAQSVKDTARQADRVLRNISDNPQSLLRGSGSVRPGPGEPGFSAP